MQLVINTFGASLRRKGDRKEPDYRKQSVHLGNGCNIDQGPLFKSGFASVSVTKVRIQIDKIARLSPGKI